MNWVVHATDNLIFVYNWQAFPKGLPLVADVFRAIIQLTENGTIVEIGQMNSSNPACAGPESAITPNSMTLQSFQVLFAITGCVTIACLLVSLIIYLYKNRGFLQGVSNFNVSIWSRIHALCRYFVKIDLSSRSKAGHTKNQIQKTWRSWLKAAISFINSVLQDATYSVNIKC